MSLAHNLDGNVATWEENGAARAAYCLTGPMGRMGSGRHARHSPREEESIRLDNERVDAIVL